MKRFLERGTFALACLLGISTTPAQPIAESIINQPIFIDRVQSMDEVQILDWLVYRGQTDLLKAIGRGQYPPENPINRLRLTFKKPVRLARTNHVVCIFESAAFINAGPPSPLVVVLMTLNLDVVQWELLESYIPMEAALIRYFFHEGGAPPDGDRAELILIGQHGRSLTGTPIFYRVGLTREKISFLGESGEWKADN
jgi:hypothetical protein